MSGQGVHHQNIARKLHGQKAHPVALRHGQMRVRHPSVGLVARQHVGIVTGCRRGLHHLQLLQVARQCGLRQLKAGLIQFDQKRLLAGNLLTGKNHLDDLQTTVLIFHLKTISFSFAKLHIYSELRYFYALFLFAKIQIII